MGIQGFQSIVMAYHYNVAVAFAITCYANHPSEKCFDWCPGFKSDISSIMIAVAARTKRTCYFSLQGMLVSAGKIIFEPDYGGVLNIGQVETIRMNLACIPGVIFFK